jgi:hypothetical protein
VGQADCAPTAPFEEKSTALLNSLWGREKIKFEHLGKTKDLAATPTETKDGNIAFLKPNRKPGPPSWPAPRGGSTDLSQLDSILPAGFVLPVAGPAIGKTTLRPGFASSANSLILAVSLQGDAGHEITPPGRSEK